MSDHVEIKDAEIVADVLGGQPERFSAIVDRYQGALRRVAQSRLGRHDLAEEAVQEAFLSAFRSLHTYDSRYSFRTWLWTILLRECGRRWQRTQRQPRVLAWTDQRHQSATGNDSRHLPETREPGPAEYSMAREQSERIERLLGQLPENQADALRLRFFGQLRFQEIADAMGCSLSSAKNRVRWGLEKMSRLIQESETTCSDSASTDSAPDLRNLPKRSRYEDGGDVSSRQNDENGSVR